MLLQRLHLALNSRVPINLVHFDCNAINNYLGVSIKYGNIQKYAVLLVLVFAGEMIFSLPFHITRFFRPIYLDVLNISNTELGDIFAVYGVVAMLSYFPGGYIADKFSARHLMSFSLFATALGGLYLYTLPNAAGLHWLFAYWGLTSILLFWAAMIKMTRVIAGQHSQGKAFGILDGGRGLIASLMAMLAVGLLSLTVIAPSVALSPADESATADSLQRIIMLYTATTALSATVVLLIPQRFISQQAEQQQTHHSASVLPSQLEHKAKSVFREPLTWLQAIVVITAYCGYKALDNYGVFAVDVLNMTPTESAELTGYLSFLRPLSAVCAGIIADRFQPSRAILALFLILLVTFVLLSISGSPYHFKVAVISGLTISSIAVFALRGVYFALLEESMVNTGQTGKAVGIISAVGYTPDIFFAPITGRLLDANPGVTGFQHYFIFIAIMSMLGLLASYFMIKRLSKHKQHE